MTWRKIVAATLTVLAILSLTALTVAAYDPNDALGDVRGYIPPELDSLVNKFTNGDITPDGVIGALNFTTAFDYLANLFKTAVREALRPLCVLLTTVVLSAVMTVLRQAIKSDALTSALGYMATLCAALSVYSALDGLVTSGVEQLRRLDILMKSMLPIMTALYAAGVNITAAAVTNAGMTAALTLLEAVLTDILLPLVKLCFVFALLGGLCDSVDVSGVGDMVRRWFTTALALVMTIFSGMMAYQNRLALATDSIAARTVRFAASNLIPMVGGAVGEAVRALGGSLSLIRATVGVLGVVGVALLMLPTLVTLLVNRSALNIVAVVSKALGCDPESRLLASVSGIVDLLIALVAAVSVFFVFALTLFIKTAAAVG